MEKLSLTGKSKHAVDDEMKGLSALFIDGEHIFIDNGAIHAKSRIEKGITFVKDAADVQNGREVVCLWITLHRFTHGQGFYGAMPFKLWIDEEAQVGYKNLANHVNQMEKAVKGNVDVSSLSVGVRRRIGNYLKSVRPDLWDNATEPFQQAFVDPGE